MMATKARDQNSNTNTHPFDILADIITHMGKITIKNLHSRRRAVALPVTGAILAIGFMKSENYLHHTECQNN